MESSSDLDQEINANMVFMAQIEKVLSNQEINANMVFMAQIEKVLSNSEASSSSADNKISETINPDFDKIDSSFQQTSSLKPYISTVILEKIIIDLEDEVVSLLEKEKENLEIIKSLKSKDVESSEKVVSKTKNKSENDCQVIEKVCVSEENTNVIAPRMFKLIVSPSVSPISVTKTSCVSNSVSKIPFRKNPSASLNVPSRSKLNKSLPRIIQFLGTVRFGNNDFAMIAGYGDVVIGSMTIKKVYYVK
nr:integrase, catalytic region, zinc finger, CCHC-type, peptidase aspartic, catalytic [Tanacetum cinerariifolium]